MSGTHVRCALCSDPLPEGKTVYCSDTCARRARRSRARAVARMRPSLATEPVAWAVYAECPRWAGPETSIELVALTTDPDDSNAILNSFRVPLYAAPRIDPNRVKAILGAALPDWFGPQLDVIANDICEALQ